MDQQEQIEQILETNIPQEKLKLSPEETKLLTKIIATQLLAARPATEEMVRLLISVMIIAYTKILFPVLESSETDYWIKKIKEILNPSGPTPPNPKPEKK